MNSTAREHAPDLARKEATLLEHRRRVLASLDYVFSNLEDPLPTEALAERVHLSPFHFHRVFRAFARESPTQHVRRLRLERAAARLWSCNDSILDIAIDSRYTSHEAFTRRFKKQFGLLPSEARRAARRHHWIRPARTREPQVEIVDLAPRRFLGASSLGDYRHPSAHDSPGLGGPLRTPPENHPSAPSVCVYWSFQDFTPVHLQRIEVGSYLPETTDDHQQDTGFEVRQLNGGRYLKGHHVGTGDELRATFQYLYWTFGPHHGLRWARQPTIIEYAPAITAQLPVNAVLLIPLD